MSPRGTSDLADAILQNENKRLRESLRLSEAELERERKKASEVQNTLHIETKEKNEYKRATSELRKEKEDADKKTSNFMNQINTLNQEKRRLRGVAQNNEV